MHAIEDGHDKNHSGAASPVLHLPEAELDSSFVLLQDPNRRQAPKRTSTTAMSTGMAIMALPPDRPLPEADISCGQIRAAGDPEPVRTGASKARLGWTGVSKVAPAEGCDGVLALHLC